MADSFAGGSGTKDDPYQIANGAQLARLGSIYTYNCYFIQTADIALNAAGNWKNSWTPIPSFHGHYDGQNYTVSGLYIKSTASYVGLFGSVGNNGTVQNVFLTDSCVSGGDYVGGVVGENFGTVENCTNSGTVSGKSDVGGVAGFSPGTVTNCTNSGTVSGTKHVGGVVGYNVSGIVENCTISSAVSGGDYVGGVVGYNFYGTVWNCANSGAASGSKYIGGVVGHNSGPVKNCTNSGDVSGNDYVGGVEGYNFGGTVTNCYYLDTCGAGGEGTPKTAEQFASGEVTYLLNGDQSEIVWYQTCGKGLPAFSGQTVYQVIGCDGVSVAYSNTPGQTGGHIYETVVKDPTCEEGGYTAYTCSACGDSYTADETAALGHDLVEETMNGVLQERCTRCVHVKLGTAAATVTGQTVTVTLAEETEPTWAYVAIYDDHGRFVEVKIGEIVDGKAEVTFTDNRIGDLKVFFLGENKTPLLNALTF